MSRLEIRNRSMEGSCSLRFRANVADARDTGQDLLELLGIFIFENLCGMPVCRLTVVFCEYIGISHAFSQFVYETSPGY